MFDIVTIGTATRDVFLRSKVFKEIRDPKRLKKIGFLTGEAQCFPLGGKIDVDELVVATGGGAANAAVTFRRQGLKTGVIAELGKDGACDDILKEFKEEKISSFAIRGNKATAYSVILLNDKGERTILTYRGASDDLGIQSIPWTKIKTKWFYVVPGSLSYETVAGIFGKLESGGAKIAFAPSMHLLKMGLLKLAPLLEQSNAVLMNREEGALLSGLNFKEEPAIFSKLDEYVKGIIVMTDGPRGVLVSDGKKIYQAGVFSAKGGSLPASGFGRAVASGGEDKMIVDRTGAGDAFGSGFVAALIGRKAMSNERKASEGDICYAVRLGTANATSVVEHVGAQTGILAKKQFETDKRWEELKVNVKTI